MLDSFAYTPLYFLFVGILLLLHTKNKSWEPYNRQLNIIIDYHSLWSLADDFWAMFASYNYNAVKIVTSDNKPDVFNIKQKALFDDC